MTILHHPRQKLVRYCTPACIMRIQSWNQCQHPQQLRSLLHSTRTRLLTGDWCPPSPPHSNHFATNTTTRVEQIKVNYLLRGNKYTEPQRLLPPHPHPLSDKRVSKDPLGVKLRAGGVSKPSAGYGPLQSTGLESQTKILQFRIDSIYKDPCVTVSNKKSTNTVCCHEW